MKISDTNYKQIWPKRNAFMSFSCSSLDESGNFFYSHNTKIFAFPSNMQMFIHFFASSLSRWWCRTNKDNTYVRKKPTQWDAKNSLNWEVFNFRQTKDNPLNGVSAYIYDHWDFLYYIVILTPRVLKLTQLEQKLK